MDAFRESAPGSATLAVVPGNFRSPDRHRRRTGAAIPAVVAYNYYINRIKVLSAQMENFSSELLNIIERHFLKA